MQARRRAIGGAKATRSATTRPPHTPCWPIVQRRSDSSRHASRTAPPAHGCRTLTLLCTGGSRHRARLLKRTAMKRCSTVWIYQSGSKRYSILPYAPAPGATPGRGWPVLVGPGCHRGWLSAKRIHGVHQLVLVDPVADEVLVRFFHLVVVPPEHVDAE